jgi:hypothetical protein
MGTWIKDIAFFKRIQNVKILNPIDHVFIEDKIKKSAKIIKKLWDGSDAVHMKKEGYMLLASYLTDLAADIDVAKMTPDSSRNISGGRDGGGGPNVFVSGRGRGGQSNRQSWVTADDAVAVRNWPSGSRGGRGGHRGIRPH